MYGGPLEVYLTLSCCLLCCSYSYIAKFYWKLVHAHHDHVLLVVCWCTNCTRSSPHFTLHGSDWKITYERKVEQEMTWEQGYSTYLKKSFSSHRYEVKAWKNLLMVGLTPHHQPWGFLTPFGAVFLTDNKTMFLRSDHCWTTGYQGFSPGILYNFRRRDCMMTWRRSKVIILLHTKNPKYIMRQGCIHSETSLHLNPGAVPWRSRFKLCYEHWHSTHAPLHIVLQDGEHTV